MYFAALEVKAGRGEDSVVHTFLTLAEKAEVKCASVDVYGVCNVHGIPFVRFKTDANLHKLEPFLADTGLSYILPDGHGFSLMSKGEEHRVSVTVMLGSKLPGAQNHSYYGTQYPGWRSQFK